MTRLRNLFAVLAWPLLMSGLLAAQEFKAPLLDHAGRMANFERHLEMRNSSPHKEYKWKHIGPLSMCGRVTDIAKPLDRPSTFYISTASGGVWKTENEGTTWVPIFEDAPSASTGTIAVDPQNSNTLWVGTGESNIFRSSMAGTGLYKSTDGGASWKYVGLGESQHIARIVIHPGDSNTVYVAACGNEYTANPERGIYKTTDGGATWNKVLYEDDMTGGYDLVIDPKDPNTLYASMWHRIRRPWSDPVPGPGGGVYRTTDGGKNWTRLTKGLPERGIAGRTGLAIAASQPSTIYAIVDSHAVVGQAEDGQRDSYGRARGEIKKGAEVYRSDDRGETWTQTSGDDRAMRGLFSTYGWVFGQIRVDPTNPEVIYTLGVPLLKSEDGGKTFKGLNYRGLHSDHHALWIDPANPNYLINGNDGGINLSYDGGKTWKNIENLPVVQFYNVAVDWAKPFNVYGSIQDNMSWTGPSDHDPRRSDPDQWKPTAGGEASYHAVDPNDPNTLYSETFYGSIIRTNLATNETKPIKPDSPDDKPLRGQWLAPFQLSPHNSQVVYHGMNRVFRSMNRGDNWECISPDLTHNDPDKQGNISFATISTLCESPLKFGLLYVGTDDGRVHVTRDHGMTWTEITKGLPPFKWVSRVWASKFKEGTVYLTLNGKTDNDFQAYVYRSDDYGATWQDISAGIPGGPINVIKEDNKHAGLLYVGSDLGVYASADDGATWQVLGSELPLTFVHDLVIHPRDNVCVVATHGRGMYTLDVRPLQRAIGRQRSPDEKPEPDAESKD